MSVFACLRQRLMGWAEEGFARSENHDGALMSHKVWRHATPPHKGAESFADIAKKSHLVTQPPGHPGDNGGERISKEMR